MDSPKTSKQSLDRLIRLEEIRLLYGGTPFSFTAAVVISLIIYAVLAGHVVSVLNLDIWLATILIVMFVRSIDSYQFFHQDEAAQQKKLWRLRFHIGTGAAGVCWGLLPWLGYSDNVEYFSFIIVCQIGVIAGSLSTLSYRWESLALFLLPSSLLLEARLLYQSGEFTDVTAIVVAVFIFFSLSAGKRIFNNTQQNIRLRIEADSREQALEMMHQKQILHIQNTPLAIIEFDINLCVTEWNPAAQDIFGYSREEAINENILRLILPRDSSDDAEKLWERLLNYEPVIGAVIENKTRSGTPIFCQWFITPLTNDQNNIVGVAAMALDITDKKHTELAIIRSKEEAEKANQAKSDFLSNMSHELRTPLNAILGFTQLLTYEKDLDDKQRSHINEIRNAGNLLLDLVNQILDLARIEKGHLQLSMEKVSLDDVLKECQSMIRPLAKQRNIMLDINTDTSGYVVADYTRLKQVMLNLLSNAIKYNRDQGRVSIKVLQKENSIVRICIIDTGQGISRELIEEIFQPFNRLNATSNIEGTGIGLSISKELMEMMKGSIGVTSTVNAGSEFWIELTGRLNTARDHAYTQTGNKQPASAVEPAPSIQRILIAEDNPTNQALLLKQLESLGYQADVVEDGQQALNRMLDHDYQLLITDCNMPVLDGYKLARTLRERGNDELPIIALTADAFPEKRTACLRAGMNEQLTKPVDLDALKATIEKFLH